MTDAQGLEAHTQEALVAPNSGAGHLDANDIAYVLQLDEQGLTQQQIAKSFTPPKHQSTISRCLRLYGTDRTAQAKRIIKAVSPQLALDIIRSKDNKTKAALLKGVNVLEEEQRAPGISLTVNGLVMTGIATFASESSQLQAKGQEIGAKDAGSDKQPYVTQLTPSNDTA